MYFKLDGLVHKRLTSAAIKLSAVLFNPAAPPFSVRKTNSILKGKMCKRADAANVQISGSQVLWADPGVKTPVCFSEPGVPKRARVQQIWSVLTPVI